MKEIREICDPAPRIFIPKGENRTVVTGLLIQAGINVPEFAPKQLTVDQFDRAYGLRRDKDIAILVLRSMGSVGFFASDTLAELDDDIRAMLEFIPVFQTDIYFALGTRQGECGDLAAKIDAGKGLIVATSNKNQTEIMAQSAGFEVAEIVNLKGGVEGVLDDDPDIDAIVDIVDSGDSMRVNKVDEYLAYTKRIQIGAVRRSAQ